MNPEWWADVCGSTVPQSAFYRHVFEELFDTGTVFVSELPSDWSPRSMRKWMARLAAGDKTTAGLNIIEYRKQGKRGRVFYAFTYEFLSNLSKTIKMVKKVKK